METYYIIAFKVRSGVKYQYTVLEEDCNKERLELILSDGDKYSYLKKSGYQFIIVKEED